jgi:hypothetical protein
MKSSQVEDLPRDREIGQDIPSLPELQNELGQDNVSKTTYNRYYEPFFEYLYSLNDEEIVTDVELFDQLDVNFGRSTYRKYLKRTIQYDPSLELKVAGYVYNVEGFIEQNAAQHDFDDIGKYINIVQHTCLSTYQELKDRYHERLIHYFRKKAESAYESKLRNDIDRNTVTELLDEYESSLAETIPEKITSVNQSGKNMAGQVNETLFQMALESAGLSQGDDFIEISGGNDTGDIQVFSEADNTNTFDIEAKSSKNRERGEFGVGSVEDPSGLIGFFDDASEFLESATNSLEEQCHVVYLRPDTLAEIARRNWDVYTTMSDDTGKLFFRANNEFGTDMKYYHKTGELPEKDLGHEGKYLESTWVSA